MTMAVTMAVTTPGKPDCCTAAVLRSHRELRGRLTEAADAVLAALPCGVEVEAARAALLSLVREEIVPRAMAEEAAVRAADRAALPVVRALPGHHRMLEVLADEIAADSGGVTTAAAVGALVLLCDARWDGTDRALLPALVATGTDLEPLVGASAGAR